MMSCVGVMYQPYSNAPLTPYLTSSVPTPVPSTSPQAQHPQQPPLTPVSYPGPDHALPLKRELIEKQYKVERDVMVTDVARLGTDSRMSGAEPYSSPRAHNGSSAGSCGTPDPRTPVSPRPASQQERESDGEADDLQRTAQYLTRNVILYTHYVGEVSNIVDEHFTKALNQSNFNENKGTPMASRNLPPSFFNANYHSKSVPYTSSPHELYSEAYTSGLHHLAAHAGGSPDPWQYAAQATATSSYHRSVQDLVNSAGSYSNPASRLQSQYSLFLNNPSRLHAAAAATHCTVKSETPWPTSSSEYHTPTPTEFSHPLDRTYSPHHYANMASTGLEAPSQDASKDIYWPTF